MEHLYENLTYSTDDERKGLPAKHNIPMKDVRTGTASLRNALGLYRKFSEAWPHGIKLQPDALPQRLVKTIDNRVNIERRRTPAAWPEWRLPDEDILLRLAHITTPYICFLRPEIVKAVVEDNERHRATWDARLQERGIDPTLYLWERSACAFPGVRRSAGSSEIAQMRGRMQANGKPESALKTDSNTYPKQIWSYVFLGRPFRNIGPPGYALAHLIDHKKYKNRASEEFAGREETAAPLALYGLYTSIANTVYMPTGLIRPTDFAFALRNLLQRQVEDLYGSFCNLLPPKLSIRTASSDAWSLEAFHWSDPVGTMDHVPAFLTYRKQEMDKLLAEDMGI